MLFTITTTHQPSSDLGYLLHKHPERVQDFKLAFGTVNVFYSEVTDERCTAVMLLDINPIDLVRGKGTTLSQYVNDRPYAASSFLSVAIAQVYGTALNGTCKSRPELAETAIPLTVTISVLPSRGGERLLHNLFEPLGYTISAERHTLDANFPEWGDSRYYTVTLEQTILLADLLSHIYVLIPVLDDEKHYFVGDEEVEKLLRHGEGWLNEHPEKEIITRRYLKYQRSLQQQALTRLIDDIPDDSLADAQEEKIERPMKLHDQRLNTVLTALKASGASTVVDLGCGEGKLIKLLLKEKQFAKILGMDVSIRSLEFATEKINRLPERMRQNLELIHGSLMYRDHRLQGFDAAAVVEVIEHLDPPRLEAFERVVFEFARPRTVVITTPNAEYNSMWETLPAGKFRHSDHRFEWTRAEFEQWATMLCEQYSYSVRFLPIGEFDEAVGAPSQMGIFESIETNGN
ncbi:MAG: 3' terminal RNA ribose 2'-O-methyltransferase Hen1 [Phototrophicaceae bacterium]